MPFSIDVNGVEVHVTCEDLRKDSHRATATENIRVADLMRFVGIQARCRVAYLRTTGGNATPIGRGNSIRVLGSDLRRRILLVAKCIRDQNPAASPGAVGLADIVYRINIDKLKPARKPQLQRMLSGERVCVYIPPTSPACKTGARTNLLTKAIDMALDADLHIDEIHWQSEAYIEEDFYTMLQRRASEIERAGRPIRLTAKVLAQGWCGCRKAARIKAWNGRFPPDTVALFDMDIGEMAFMGCNAIQEMPPGAKKKKIHYSAFIGTAIADEDDALLDG